MRPLRSSAIGWRLGGGPGAVAAALTAGRGGCGAVRARLGAMWTEVSTAAAFITGLLRAAGGIGEEQLRCFRECLQEALLEHYKHHWFPLVPSKGSGYRCIRINHQMDPLIGKAAEVIGLSHEKLFQLLPSELTLWVDPFEVSYRIGEDGSICVLYESPQPGGITMKTYPNCFWLVDHRIIEYSNPPAMGRDTSH
uniref:Anti-proliferative protein domain-containing protein n=1 Tax=Amazona collaria TaxID=241587 RepID=A0A8B9G136_9PSIT